jgi:hypothetical protein
MEDLDGAVVQRGPQLALCSPLSKVVETRCPSATTADGQAYSGAWTTQTVTVTFNCADSGSGPVNASVSQTVSTDGASQSATGTCTDNAGNSASATFGPINIASNVDTTPPDIPVFTGIAAQTYPVADLPPFNTIGCTSNDPPSNSPASCTVSSDGYSTAFGAHTLTAIATDKAGNTSTNTLTYVVGLQSGNILSPVTANSNC